MELNELMIGDWVSYKGKPHKVNGIEDNHLYLKNPNGSVIMALPDEITPIPVSKEILKKNGFDLTDMEEFARLDFADGKFVIRAMYHKDSGKQTGWAYFAFNVLSIIDYVHQLQHAFRICEIKQEINL